MKEYGDRIGFKERLPKNKIYDIQGGESWVDAAMYLNDINEEHVT